MELTKELQDKVNEIVDARIAELFQSGQLQINLTKSSRYSWDEWETYYTVSVNMNGKEVYKAEEFYKV